MRDTSDIKSDSETFIEADQLIDTHREPIALMLGIQIAVLGGFGILLTGLPMAVQVMMAAMLCGFLWYADSFWLLPFCLVVFSGQMISSDGRHFTFLHGVHLAECILLLLTLIASFRYIELRRYSKTFGLNSSYRQLKRESNRNWSWLTLVLGQFVRRQWYHTTIAMVVAFGVLWRFPASDYWRNELWMQPVAARFILLSLMLFVGWFVCRGVLSMWDWILLTPKQADVAFRSWANREFWGSMAGVERRAERLRIKEED